MKRQNRKAFTIVELVIVIAVIAILAAVLIPTFSSLISTAKMSSDTQLAKNMNTALSIAEAEDGKNITFYDAMADVLEAGYTVEKLTPTSEGCHLVWDQKNDRIVFLDSNKEELYAEKSDYADSDLWFVAKTLEEATNKGYNVYLAGTALTGTVEVNSGIDVGANTGITAINYENTTGNAQNVIIRTNGGTLTVNAPTDTVRHYGYSDNVVITAIHSASFHEHGVVGGFVELLVGNYVAEAGSEATVKITSTTGTDVKVETKQGASVEVVIESADETVQNAIKGNLTGVNTEEVKTSADIVEVDTLTELTDAIANYTAGKIIYCKNGTYNLTGHINIAKPIVIKGESKAGVVLYGNVATYRIIYINSENVNISNITLKQVVISSANEKTASGLKLSSVVFDGNYVTSILLSTTATTGQAANYNKDKANNISIVNCTFEKFKNKGIYFERANNLTIDRCTFNGPDMYDTNRPEDFANNTPSGIDLNFKYDTYENINITNCSFNDLGKEAAGAAILLKQRGNTDYTTDGTNRGDGASYIANKATVSKVTITGNTFVGCDKKVQFGELAQYTNADAVNKFPARLNNVSNLTIDFDMSADGIYNCCEGGAYQYYVYLQSSKTTIEGVHTTK